MSEIIIVGAGVVGLTTALALSEETAKPSSITVISEYSPDTSPYPAQYTSPWAGAHFRPCPSRDEFDNRDYPFSRETLKTFKEMAKSHPESSVQLVKGLEYFDAPEPHYQKLGEGWREGIDNFRFLDKSEMPAGCVLGAEYDTWALNPPVYLQFLYRTLKIKYDVRFVSAKLDSLKQAASYANGKNAVIVNCTGQGLQWNGGYDEKSYVIRGQTLLLNPPKDLKVLKSTATHQSQDNLWTFYIPRPLHGGVILGGTKQPRDMLSTPREEDTKALIERGTRLFPQLMKTNAKGEKYFDIVRINVGFRPARIGGVNVSEDFCEGYRVVNGYGCAGSGYEYSWGIARKIVGIVEKRDARL